MDHQFLLSLLILSLCTSFASSQQNYSAVSAGDCDIGNETGPSSAFLYTCNSESKTCRAFLIFVSQPSYDSVPTISALTSTSQDELARINNVTRLSVFPHNKEVIVPVSCSCLGQYYQANTSFYVRDKLYTYYTISQAFQGLSPCAALKRANMYSDSNLKLGMELKVPLRCACPTASQAKIGIRYLLSYPVGNGDIVFTIAKRFNVSEESTFEANGLQESQMIYPDTMILIPLTTEPVSLQTKTREELPEVSPPQALGPNNRRSNRKVYEKVGIAAASALLALSIMGAALFYFQRERKKKVPEIDHKKEKVSQDLRIEIASVEQALKVFGIRELKKATENFSLKHRIKGSVYWGDFGGEVLAIKKMSRDVSKEVNVLKRINHFNLIKLRGVCENFGCPYLIFEYMKNGSLQEWISRTRSNDIGSWITRIQIALDVANGLYYLHSFTQPTCVHKDISSSNILLDDNFRAKIANFSLARSATGTTNSFLTKRVEGTGGYMAPEYTQAGQVTPKIDVYAFGVVLLELVTGKDAIFVHNGGEALLSSEIASIWEKENTEAELAFFIDPSFTGSHEKQLALRLTRLSLACLEQVPAKRPDIGEVVSALMKIQIDWKASRLSSKVDANVPQWHSSIGGTSWKAEAI